LKLRSNYAGETDHKGVRKNEALVAARTYCLVTKSIQS